MSVKKYDTNGKGDKRRPMFVPTAQFYQNWNRIFKQTNEKLLEIRKHTTLSHSTRNGCE